MTRIENVAVTELRCALDEVEDSKPAKRLMAAIAYKNGVTQTELAEWFGVQRRTVYSWLERFENESVERAAYDDHRTGRPRKLADEDRERLRETLRTSPAESGYDAESWSPALVRRHVAERYDVDYSLPSCRRLLREAGLRYRTPSSDAGSGDGGAWVVR